MSTGRAPIYDALLRHSRMASVSFHVPGHKSGRGLPDLFAGAGSLDLTELSGLDDLHAPTGVISEAQKLAARCFGAEDTYFLVGGSTAGNLAMIMTICNPGDLLIVQRDAHKSIIHGLMLAGAKAAFVHPEIDESTGLSEGLAVSHVEEALKTYPEAKGVFITSPSYYGRAAQVADLAEVVHRYGKPLLVDEAHGAHFGFHPAFPKSAMQQGADAAVQSAHKMLPVLTMGAMLHVQGQRVDRQRLRNRLAMVQTSSPSYLVLAALDLARMRLATEGEALFETALESVSHFHKKVSSLGTYKINGNYGQTEPNGMNKQDPFKQRVVDATGTLDGFTLAKQLEQRGCYAEMADPEGVLLALSNETDRLAMDRCFAALQEITVSFALEQKELSPIVPNKHSINKQANISEPMRLEAISLEWVYASGKTVTVQAEASVGRIAAEMVIPYPPGIPILFPGERISVSTIEQLLRLAAAGARFQGSGEDHKQIRVLTADAEADWEQA